VKLRAHLRTFERNAFKRFLQATKGDWPAKPGFGGQWIGKKLVITRYFFCDFFFCYNKISLVCGIKG
jgi:hypothetical protein